MQKNRHGLQIKIFDAVNTLWALVFCIYVTAVGDARWIGGLTKVAIYPTPKGCGLCCSSTRSEGHKVVNYLVNLQTT